MRRNVCLLSLLMLGIAGWSVTATGGIPVADSSARVPLCVGRLIAYLPSGTTSAVDATFQYINPKKPEPGATFKGIEDNLLRRKNDYAGLAMQRSVRHDAMERAAGFDPDKTYGKTKLVGFRDDASVQQIAIGYHPELTSSNTMSEVDRVIDGIEYRFTSSGFGADQYPTVRDAMWGIALNFQPLARGEVPTSPGFCVAGGMFADAGHAPLHESFTLVAKFKDHPDARFVIDANAINTPDTDEPSLKHRVDSELGILRANVDGHVSVLVRGERDAVGQKGYQIGLSVPNDTVPNTTAYKFFWSADGTPKDASRPALEVSLTIQPESDKPASFSDAKQAEVLWDQLLNGLHIRPGSVAR